MAGTELELCATDLLYTTLRPKRVPGILRFLSVSNLYNVKLPRITPGPRLLYALIRDLYAYYFFDFEDLRKFS